MGKRINGEGTIFKRKDGRWVAQAHVKLVDGVKKRISATAKTKQLAKEKLDGLLGQKNRYTSPSDKNWTVAEYLDYWMSNIHYKNIREQTKVNYSVFINKHIKPTMGNHKLCDFSVFNIRSALDVMEQNGVSARVRLECLRVLSVCLNYAMSEEGGELVTRNVAQLAKKPKYKAKETVIWTLGQAKLFLQAAKEHPKFIAYLLIIIYGLRRGEAAGLCWRNIDFENNVIHIRQQIIRLNGKLVACDLKTENGRRDLPMMDFVRNALLEHAKKHNITIQPYDPENSELSTEGTVVISEAGTPLEPQNLLRSFRILTKKVGLPQIKLHALRHLAATILKDLKVPTKDIQLILGHADSSTTLKFYQHGTKKTMDSAIASMESALCSHLMKKAE